jgi:hypothetical protein
MNIDSLSPMDDYFLKKNEPIRSYLFFLRDHILSLDNNLAPAWKYGMPFFCYKGKMFCYLWIDKKLQQPYLGIVEGRKINHPRLIQAKRTRMKILLLDPKKNVPVGIINSILRDALKLYG